MVTNSCAERVAAAVLRVNDGLPAAAVGCFQASIHAVYLVRPDIALAQRPAHGTAVQSGEPTAATGSTTDRPGTTEQRESTGAGSTAGAGLTLRPAMKTRYFAVARIDPEKYGRDLTRLQQEILSHLADPDVGNLTITVEIEASKPDGFSDDKVRIITENARVLRFDQSDFE